MTTEYFQITKEEECSEDCIYYGWSVEKNELAGLEPGGSTVEIYRNVTRMVTETKLYNITLIGQLNSKYITYINPSGHVDTPILVSFNGVNSFNLYSGNTYDSWMLDSEEIIPNEPYGTGIYTLRREYTAYGQWRYINWTDVEDADSIPCTITSDSISGDWFDLISYKTSKYFSTKAQSNLYEKVGSIYEYVVDEKLNRSKLMQVQISQIHDNITNITPSSGCAIYTQLEGVFNSTSSSDQKVTNKVILPISDVAVPIGGGDQDRAFRLMSQEITPYDKKGGKFCRLSNIYQCVGADIGFDIKIINPWVP